MIRKLGTLAILLVSLKYVSAQEAQNASTSTARTHRHLVLRARLLNLPRRRVNAFLQHGSTSKPLLFTLPANLTTAEGPSKLRLRRQVQLRSGKPEATTAEPEGWEETLKIGGVELTFRMGSLELPADENSNKRPATSRKLPKGKNRKRLRMPPPEPEEPDKLEDSPKREHYDLITVDQDEVSTDEDTAERQSKTRSKRELPRLVGQRKKLPMTLPEPKEKSETMDPMMAVILELPFAVHTIEDTTEGRRTARRTKRQLPKQVKNKLPTPPPEQAKPSAPKIPPAGSKHWAETEYYRNSVLKPRKKHPRAYPPFSFPGGISQPFFQSMGAPGMPAPFSQPPMSYPAQYPMIMRFSVPRQPMMLPSRSRLPSIIKIKPHRRPQIIPIRPPSMIKRPPAPSFNPMIPPKQSKIIPIRPPMMTFMPPRPPMIIPPPMAPMLIPFQPPLLNMIPVRPPQPALVFPQRPSMIMPFMPPQLPMAISLRPPRPSMVIPAPDFAPGGPMILPMSPSSMYPW